MFSVGSFIPEILQNRICSPLCRNIQIDDYDLDLQNNYDLRKTISQTDEEPVTKEPISMETTSIEETLEAETGNMKVEFILKKLTHTNIYYICLFQSIILQDSVQKG